MEAIRIQQELKYVEINGTTLSVEERIKLDLAFATLRQNLPEHAGSLFLWGKVRGKLTITNQFRHDSRLLRELLLGAFKN